MQFGKKYIFIIIGCFILLTSFQNQVPLTDLGKDTTMLQEDTLLVKDTLLIRYVPVIPTSFQIADAWFLQKAHQNVKDSNFNALKMYKNYFKNIFTFFAYIQKTSLHLYLNNQSCIKHHNWNHISDS